jgi:hypothetical protein
MNMPDYDKQKLGFWGQIRIRLEPPGFVAFILGTLVLLAVFIAPISADLQINLLGISLALFSVGLGLIAVGISAKSDIRYTEILSRIDTNLTRVLEFYKPSEDELEFPPGSPRNVVIKPPVATAHADVAAPKVEVTTPELSKAQAQARLDADIRKVGYRRGELFQKEDGSWGIRWGGKYPL